MMRDACEQRGLQLRLGFCNHLCSLCRSGAALIKMCSEVLGGGFGGKLDVPFVLLIGYAPSFVPSSSFAEWDNVIMKLASGG